MNSIRNDLGNGRESLALILGLAWGVLSSLSSVFSDLSLLRLITPSPSGQLLCCLFVFFFSSPSQERYPDRGFF